MHVHMKHNCNLLVLVIRVLCRRHPYLTVHSCLQVCILETFMIMNVTVVMLDITLTIYVLILWLFEMLFWWVVKNNYICLTRIVLQLDKIIKLRCSFYRAAQQNVVSETCERYHPAAWNIRINMSVCRMLSALTHAGHEEVTWIAELHFSVMQSFLCSTHRRLWQAQKDSSVK